MFDLEVRLTMCREAWVVGRDLAGVPKFAPKEWAINFASLPQTCARFPNALLDGVARAAQGMKKKKRGWRG